MKKLLFCLAIFGFFVVSFSFAIAAGTSYDYPNPLAGQPTSFQDLIGIIANFIFNLGIPVSVIIIIYGGFRMLTSGGTPKNYQAGLNALKYAVMGLAVLLIAKGFVSLVKTFLNVK